MLNKENRPTRPHSETQGSVRAKRPTFTGNRALQLEEPLLFEIGRTDISGVDVDVPEAKGDRLGAHRRRAPIDLPALSEPEAMRHYVRLSQKNYAIDMGVYPLGSCTMKHNPRLNEQVARLPGFADIHPLQPTSSAPGALELIHELGRGSLS
jgi:glycine dehydrogenase subunit 2